MQFSQHTYKLRVSIFASVIVDEMDGPVLKKSPQMKTLDCFPLTFLYEVCFFFFTFLTLDHFCLNTFFFFDYRYVIKLSHW